MFQAKVNLVIFGLFNPLKLVIIHIIRHEIVQLYIIL